MLIDCRLAYHYSCSGNVRKHHAFRHAIRASHNCFCFGNIALGVCYIALASNVANSVTQLQKLLEIVEKIEATTQGVSNAIADHIAQLRLRIANQICTMSRIVESPSFTESCKCILS